MKYDGDGRATARFFSGKGATPFRKPRFHVVATGPCPLLCPVPFTCLSPCRRGQRQPQPAALTVQGK
ncbi:TPA: hypothetical protein IHL91_004544 [Escherichia coli]|nr:hypothetical protein [Escherichia coli]HAO2834667.1 hypothetical protein [Escherichia coli]